MPIELTATETSELVTAANAARALAAGAAQALQDPAGGKLAALLIGLALDRLDAAGVPVLAAVDRAETALDELAAQQEAAHAV